MEVLKKMKRKKKKKELLEKLNMALDDMGNPKCCTRTITKDIIVTATKLFPGQDYGNAETGYMNIDQLCKLRRKLEKQFAKIDKKKRKRRLFINLYRALDFKGLPKLCTRKVTKEVIMEAEQLFPGKNYGNAETGVMKTKALYKLRKKLQKKYNKKRKGSHKK